MTMATRNGLRSVARTIVAQPWPIVRSVAVPAGITALGLFLRTYRLEIISVNFDTYEQLAATTRLLSADFPISRIYPSGIAVIMAVPMSILPRTVTTMQAVIIGCSVTLPAVAYVAVRRVSGDALAASLLGLAIALSPRMVYNSRFGLFDMVNALGLVLVIFLVPALRRRPLALFIAYGVLLAVVVSIRTTNLAVLPALAIYWLDPRARRPTPRDVSSAFLRQDVLAAGTSFLSVWVLLALAGGFARQASSAPFALHNYAARVVLYELFIFSDFAVWLVLPLAILGAQRLWRVNPTVVAVATYMTVVWPVVHAPVAFFEDRYMFPALCFGLFLAAHGASDVLRRAHGSGRGTALCVVALALFGGYQLALDGYLLQSWPARASVGAEAVYRELRPKIAALDGGSLVITTHSRGLRAATPSVRYLDLIDQSLPSGIDAENTQAMLRVIRETQNEGRAVYYLYSDFEAEQRDIGLPGPTYDAYFSAVVGCFDIREIYRASSVEEFRLYEIGKPMVSAALPAFDSIAPANITCDR